MALAACLVLWSAILGAVVIGRDGCRVTLSTPRPDAGVPRAPDSGVDASYPIPSQLEQIAWPEPPRIEREIEVSDTQQLILAVGQSGTHARVSGRHDAQVFVRASDFVLDLDDHAYVQRVYVEQGVERVVLRGGTVGSIELAAPIDVGAAEPAVREELWVRDVRIERMRVGRSPDPLVLRGQRVALVDVYARGDRHAVWFDDTLGVGSADVTIASCRLDSDGFAPTVELRDVARAIVIDSRLANLVLPTLDVGGRSGSVFVGRTVFAGMGARVGVAPDDQIERACFGGNAFHHQTGSTLEVGLTQVETLIANGNRVFTDGRSELSDGYPGAPAHWQVAGNVVAPYVAPPAD